MVYSSYSRFVWVDTILFLEWECQCICHKAGATGVWGIWYGGLTDWWILPRDPVRVDRPGDFQSDCILKQHSKWRATWVFFSAFSFLITCVTLAFPESRAERPDWLLNANMPQPVNFDTCHVTQSSTLPALTHSHKECQGEMMLDKLRISLNIFPRYTLPQRFPKHTWLKTQLEFDHP